MEAAHEKPATSPFDQASICSKINSWWANHLVWKTFKTGLLLEELPDAPEHSKAQNAEANFNSTVPVRLAPNQSRWKTLLYIFKIIYKFSTFVFLISLLIAFVLQLAMVAQCFLIDGLMRSFLAGDKNYMYIYGGCICISTFLTGNLFAAKFQLSINVGIKLQAAYCSAIIKKVLAKTEYEMATTSSGNVKNLASVDTNIIRFATGMVLFGTDILFAIVLCGLAAWWLIGWFTIFPISILIIYLIVQLKLSLVYNNLRNKSMVQTDARIALVSDILKGIRIIKMNAWEKHFQNEVDHIRCKEFSYLGMIVTLRSTIIAIYYVLARVELFIILLAYYFWGDGFPHTQIFSLLGIFNILRVSFGYNMPTLFELSSVLIISISRIEEFLNAKDEKMDLEKPIQIPEVATGNVTLTGVSCSWKDNSSNKTPVLKNITFAAKRGQLVGIIGSFGSGKTSILKAILGELPPTAGNISKHGKIAYVPQDAWIFPSSFQQNITFGHPLDEEKLEQTIDICALTKDVATFRQGIQQFVGENGNCLSGGQKSRLNLARAVYEDADIYLLDDPFSAVDARSARIIFKKCIAKFMKNRTCILVTNHLPFLKDADNILVIKSGECIASGKYESIRKYEDQLQIVQKEKSESESTTIQNNYGSTDTLPANELDIEEVDPLLEQANKMATDQVAKGHVSHKVFWEFFTINMNKSVPILFIISMVTLICLTCIFDTQVKKWVNAEVSWITFVESKALLNGTDTTITESLGDHRGNQIMYLMSVGAYLGATTILSVITLNIMGALCRRGSQGIHLALLRSVTRAKMSEFERQPVGNFINRFSLDTSRADTFVPHSAFDFVVDTCSASGFIIITILQNYWLAIPCAVITVLIGLFFVIINKTVRDSQRLDGVASSPKYTHLNNTIAGASVIRAFSKQDIIIQEFQSHVDRHSSAAFLNMTFMHWGYKAVFNTSCFYVCCVVFLLVSTSDLYNTNIGDIGLAMVSAFFLAEVMFAICFRYTMFECEMTSVERILNYSNLPPEAPLDSKPENAPPSDWPKTGQINFQDVSLSFSTNGKQALSNINLHVEPAEKVGIVGRTGAGKTSILTALFRLHEPEGTITIDGVCTKDIGLHDLRSIISIIPQDPMLFCGTIRKNVDPLNMYSDDKLTEALDKVQMLKAIRTLPKGLDSNVSEGGSNLSVGERQLVCIARAILQQNKILVLDEATANVDDKTDELIQRSIRDHFGDCTVITIAHRLHTVMDANRIMVMDAGEIVEFGDPKTLLQNTDGYLYKLSQQSKTQLPIYPIITGQKES